MSTTFNDIDSIKQYIASINHMDWEKDFEDDPDTVAVNGVPVEAAFKFESKRNDLTPEQRKGRIAICKFRYGFDCWLIASNGMCVRL